jgi:hypothetical protein
MSLSFSVQVECNCDGCGHSAAHGFFLSQESDPDSELFLCTGCAQRDLSRRDLEDAIEEHRQVCFDRAEAAQAEVDRCDEIITDWLGYCEEEPVAC